VDDETVEYATPFLTVLDLYCCEKGLKIADNKATKQKQNL